MAILRILTPPITAEVYDAVNERLAAHDSPPEGLILHTGGDNGGAWQIVDVWVSLEHARAFDEERLAPAIREVTGQAPNGSPLQEIIYELHDMIVP